VKTGVVNFETVSTLRPRVLVLTRIAVHIFGKLFTVRVEAARVAQRRY